MKEISLLTKILYAYELPSESIANKNKSCSIKHKAIFVGLHYILHSSVLYTLLDTNNSTVFYSVLGAYILLQAVCGFFHFVGLMVGAGIGASGTTIGPIVYLLCIGGTFGVYHVRLLQHNNYKHLEKD